MQARFAASDLGLERSGISLQRLAPNASQPFGHHHKGQEELYVVVDGSGSVKLDDDMFEVGAWDAVRVAPEVMRGFAAGPDGLEFLAFGAPAVVAPMEDVEMEQGSRALIGDVAARGSASHLQHTTLDRPSSPPPPPHPPRPQTPHPSSPDFSSPPPIPPSGKKRLQAALLGP